MTRCGIAARTTLVVAVAMSAACGASTTEVFSLEVGDCFEDPPSTQAQVAEVTIVDCDDPHDQQVYSVFEIDEAGFPGQEQIDQRARQGCVDRFEDYVGVSYADSELFATWLYPTEVSWDAGDREVVCVLFLEDDQLVGAQRGVER